MRTGADGCQNEPMSEHFGAGRGRRVPPPEEYEYQRLYLPRGTDRQTAVSVLTARAEYGRWELARLRLYPDGSRRIVLRRRILRHRPQPVPVAS